ncbi:MAG: hypothetical protein GX596_07505 [Propionibacterium sp.]|nr:hypothetical protein [Propionibacterium sp.]
MPRRSWRDMAGDHSPGGDLAPPPAGSDDVQPAALLHRAARASPALAGLLAEREQLEGRLAGLTGAAGGAVDAVRAPVAPLAERRAEIERWARARDARRGDAPRPEPPGISTDRRRRDAEPGTARPDPMSLPRTGLGRSDRADAMLRRVDDLLSLPRRVADGWEERRTQAEQEVTGAMDRFGSYARFRERVLDLDTGGSGDLDERAEAALARAIERRRAERDETARLDRRAAGTREM